MPTHGVLQSLVPWATPGSKFTLLFERLAIDWLREAAVAAVARQLHLGWDAVWGIARRAVARGLARRETLALRYVGVDEKSFQRRHDYVTVVSDLDESRILFVADDRKQESLEAFWARMRGRDRGCGRAAPKGPAAAPSRSRRGVGKPSPAPCSCFSHPPTSPRCARGKRFPLISLDGIRRTRILSRANQM